MAGLQRRRQQRPYFHPPRRQSVGLCGRSRELHARRARKLPRGRARARLLFLKIGRPGRKGGERPRDKGGGAQEDVDLGGPAFFSLFWACPLWPRAHSGRAAADQPSFADRREERPSTALTFGALAGLKSQISTSSSCSAAPGRQQASARATAFWNASPSLARSASRESHTDTTVHSGLSRAPPRTTTKPRNSARLRFTAPTARQAAPNLLHLSGKHSKSPHSRTWYALTGPSPLSGRSIT